MTTAHTCQDAADQGLTPAQAGERCPRCTELAAGGKAEAVTVTLAPSADVAGRLEVLLDGQLAGTIRDGGHIIRNADRVLAASRAYRSAGYDLDAAGNLTALAIRLK